jgi:hypothetical protein
MKADGPLYQGGRCQIPIGRNPDGSPEYETRTEGTMLILSW